MKTIPRLCKICQHEKKSEINNKLLNGISITKLARGYNVSYQSLKRHRRNHLNIEHSDEYKIDLDNLNFPEFQSWVETLSSNKIEVKWKDSTVAEFRRIK